MEVKSPDITTDRMMSSPDTPGRPSTESDEKYKGSRKAAERSRASYHKGPARPPRDIKKRSKRKAVPGWVKLIGVLAALALIGAVILEQTGVLDLSSLTGVTEKNRSDSGSPAREKPVLPEKQSEPPAQPPETTEPIRPEKVVEPHPDSSSADPLKNLIALKKFILSGQYPAEVRRSFNRGCLDQIAVAVDYYERGLARQGNLALSGLDDVLNPELVEKMNIEAGLVLKGVSAKLIRSAEGEKSLKIEGRIENGSPNTWDRILLLSILNDQEGAVVAKSFTLAGRTIPEADYFKPHQARARTLLNTQPGAETVLRPGESAPFLFVFSNPPKAAQRFSVKIVLAPEGPPE